MMSDMQVVDQNSFIPVSLAPQCSRCMGEAARRHDKKRWWCKYCRKPFTPGIHQCQVCKHVPTKMKRYGRWMCNGCFDNNSALTADLSKDAEERAQQLFEEYSCHLLFGLRNPTALSLFEQKAMQMMFQELVEIHGTEAFSRSFADFLQHSGKIGILSQVNNLLATVN